MKKLYQVNVKTEIQIPPHFKREEFIKLIGGNEKNLRSEINILVSSENQEDAIVDGLLGYIRHAANNVYDYSGVISRGELRNRYKINISICDGDKQIPTVVNVDLFPSDLGL